MKKKISIRRLLSALSIPLCLIAAAVIFALAVSNLQAGQTEEYRAKLEETLRLSAVACFANEGVYPPDLSYLTEHYGVQIDTEKYAVFYHAFAENLMPDITVVLK